MKISDNYSGTYNVYAIRQQAAAAARAKETTSPAVSNEEKAFFMDMYPEQKTEIQDYHFYQRSGKMSGVSVGSLFDRRM